MKTLQNVMVAVFFSFFAVGCQSAYEWYEYKPHPASEEVTLSGDGGGRSVSVLASILGIRERDELGTVVEVRMRVDNHTGRTVEVEGDRIQLFAADLSEFSLVERDPAVLPDLSPGEDVTVDARFAFPKEMAPGSTDLAGLSLRWTLRVDGRTVTRTTTFERSEREEYKDYNSHYYHPFYYHGSFHYRWW